MLSWGIGKYKISPTAKIAVSHRRMRFSCINKKGQAVVEMALFGSLVLLIFATLLSYMQRLNDQQYVQMEAFRRGLQKANDYAPATGGRGLQKANDYAPATGGRGASVQFSLIQNRRHSDISGGFRKGSAQTLSASSNVFWAVPAVGKQTESLIGYRINEDEKVANLKEFVPEDKREEWSFRTEDLNFNSNLSFNETTTKAETPEAITNADTSQLKDTITTTIPYTIRLKDGDDDPKRLKDGDDDLKKLKDGDDDPNNDPIITQGIFWEPQQGVYVDIDGQYKYSQQAKGTVVERAKTWTTPF